MVGGLVEKQEIGFGEHKFCQRDTPFFSTGKKRNLFVNVIPGKEESSEDVADLRIVEIRVVIVDLVKNRFFFVQHIVFLIVISQFDICAKDGSTLIRGFQFAEHLEKSGFTGSVFPNQSNTFSAK